MVLSIYFKRYRTEVLTFEYPVHQDTSLVLVNDRSSGGAIPATVFVSSHVVNTEFNLSIISLPVFGISNNY